MRSKLSLAAVALVASLALMTLGVGIVSACTFSDGHEQFQYDLDAQGYAVREGSMKMGEQVSFISRGGMMDVFIFNEDQYYTYVTVGSEKDGWQGAALHKDLGVLSSYAIFTAPTDGNYFYVIDNTVAGSDPGAAQKVITLDSVYPFSDVEDGPFPSYQMIVIGGLVIFALGILVVFSREDGK